MSFIVWCYLGAVLALAVFGFNMVALTALAAWLWRRERPTPVAHPAQWPTVTVQLPLYNERYVVERLIDAACALDYPPDLLSIQVLDDSTDETAALARTRVAYQLAHGRDIRYRHRLQRTGFKAGALAEGMAHSTAEFLVVFDADFVPPPDFLRHALPPLLADAGLGAAQARWTHLNADHNGVTRAAALALDSYFTVDQMTRSRLGWWLNFNGSAGVWRRSALIAAGGWQGDTLAEDLDLSYRAQLAGWRIAYLPHVTAPAEIPDTVLAFKRQQSRWATGAFQVWRKLGWRVWQTPLPVINKLQAGLHLLGYLPHPLMLLALLLSGPLVMWPSVLPIQWGWIGLAGFGPALAFAFGQVVLYKDWPRRLLYFPVLILLGIGMAVANSHAAWLAFFQTEPRFQRTPKNLPSDETRYALPLDWTTWGELILALYATLLTLFALERAPDLAPSLALFALGFGFTAGLSLWQSGGLRRVGIVEETVVE